jgi:hypothetical protein
MADAMLKKALLPDGDDGYSVDFARSRLDRAAIYRSRRLKAAEQGVAYWSAQLSFALARDGLRPWVKPTLTTHALDETALGKSSTSDGVNSVS